MPERWVTVKTAAKIQECTKRNIIHLIHGGKLKAKKAGNKWLVWMDVAEEFEEEGEISEKEILEVAGSPEVFLALQSQLKEKDKQIEEKDKQIASLQGELSESRQRSDTIILQLTRQLEQSQRLLEFHEEPWYKRWFGKREGKQ